MNDTELEAMHVRLYGDGSSYESMLRRAAGATRETALEVERSSNRIEHFGDALQSFANSAATALAAIGAEHFLRTAFDRFAEYETTTIRLTSAIRGNGHAVEETMRRYEEFAEAQQTLAGIMPHTTLNLLRTAESYRLSGEAAEKATQDAIALSFATRGNADAAEHMMRMTAAMTQGNVKMAMMMGRMVPQLRQFHGDSAGFIAAYQRLITTGVATSAEVMNSATGVVKRHTQAWYELTKQFGQYVAEFALPVLKRVTEIIEKFSHLDEVTKRIIVSGAMLSAGLLALGPAVSVFSSVAVPAFAAMQHGLGLVLRTVLSIGRPLSFVLGLLASFPMALPITAALLAGTAVLSVWITKVGGIGNAIEIVKAKFVAGWDWIKESGGAVWEYIKDKAGEFLEWASPAIAAYAGAVVAWWNFLYEAGSEMVTSLWTAVKWAWRQIVGESEVDWNGVRDVIVGALVSVEFFLTNWQRTFSVAAYSAEYQMTRVFNVIVFWFTDTAPHYIAMFISAFIEVLKGVGDAAAELGGQLWDIMWGSGDLDLTPIETRINTAVSNLRLGYGSAPTRLEGDIERQLRREFDTAANALGEDWQTFYDRRVAEINQFRLNLNFNEDTEKLARRNPGTVLEQGFNAATKAVHKFDSALFGSREAVYRQFEYLDSLERKIEATGGGRSTAGGEPASNAPGAAPSPSPTPQASEPPRLNTQRIEDLLKDIRDDARARPGLQGANL